MATTYIGYMSAPADSPIYADLRNTGAPAPALLKKRNEFPKHLPKTCKLVGSWSVLGPAPNVVVVEAESIADLQHIDTYYAGWVIFDWHPCVPMPRE